MRVVLTDRWENELRMSSSFRRALYRDLGLLHQQKAQLELSCLVMWPSRRRFRLDSVPSRRCRSLSPKLTTGFRSESSCELVLRAR